MVFFVNFVFFKCIQDLCMRWPVYYLTWNRVYCFPKTALGVYCFASACLCWRLFVLHFYLLRLLLILCLIYIKMPLFHIIYIHIAKMTVSFTFVVIDYIISNCWMSIVIVLLKCIFRPFRYPYILRPTFYLI